MVTNSKLTPPPIGAKPGDFVWEDWWFKVRTSFNNILHNTLRGLQGGDGDDQYYHLDEATWNTVSTISSGTYTPTAYDYAGWVTDPVAQEATWWRIGDVITVSGKITGSSDPITNAYTSLDLPITTNGGTGSGFGHKDSPGGIKRLDVIFYTGAPSYAFVQQVVGDTYASADWTYEYTYSL